MTTDRRRSKSRRATRIQQDARARKTRARAHLAKRVTRGAPSRGGRASPTRAPKPRRRSTWMGGARLGGWLQRRSTKGVLFGAAGAVGLLCAWLLQEHGFSRWTGHEALPVATISVLGNERLGATAVATATGVERGADLRRVDAAEVERQLAAHPWIASASVLALPTGRLLVRVQERVPIAVHRTDGAKDWRWVDGEGVAFAVADPAEIARWPRLEGGPTPDRAGASSDLAFGASLAAQAHSHGIAGPVRVRLPASDAPDLGWILVPAAPELEAILGSERERMPERIGRLARLLLEDAARARQASHIDLRFSGRAFLRFAEAGTSELPLHEAADTSGGRARMRDAVRTGPTG